MKKKTRQMSLLEFDIMMSRKHRLEEYANMPKEEKDKLQEEYINELVQSICERAENGERNGEAGIATQPKQIYPHDKMIRDIKEKLAKNNIKVKNLMIVRNTIIHRIVAYRFEWEKLN